MQSINNYDVYIFDCDGVILNSNQLKIEAMNNTLKKLIEDPEIIENCIEYFKCNFGKSRFHHAEYFVENILPVKEKELIKQEILENFSSQCVLLYRKAEVTPGFIEFIERLQGHKYVASGSEQDELRQVFKNRGLDMYFEGVFGSPSKKSDLVSYIKLKYDKERLVMIGDAMSDLEAARVNGIDFVAYTRFSNVTEIITRESNYFNYMVIDDWGKI